MMKLTKHTPLTLFVAAAGLVANTQVGASVILSSNFDGSTGVGPALQKVDNGSNGTGTFDPATGVVTTSGGANSSVGFNTSSLVAVPVGTTSITTSFVVSGGDLALAGGNGLFFGLVTGTDATTTTGPGLFNNNPAAVGIHLFNSNGVYTDNLNFLQDPDGGSNANVDETILASGFPTTPSMEDGFTLVFTINDDNTWSASSTGLSNDFTNVTGTLTSANGNADFNTFVTQGLGVYGGVQALSSASDTASFTIDSVVVNAIPEPSSLLLLSGGLGAFLVRRRK